MGREPQSALAVATRALARRDFSERGLRERLRRACITSSEAEEALSALLRAGLVNDARFALSRAESLAERGKGNARRNDGIDQHSRVTEQHRADRAER